MRDTGKGRVSLKEISERAKVTQSTASRILNNAENYKYAESTVERVRQIAAESSYRVNQVYRSAFTGKTKSVGVICSLDGFHRGVIDGIHDRLLRDGYAMLLGVNARNYDDVGVPVERRVIGRLNEHRVDGFILRPTVDDAGDEHFQEIITQDLPLVVLDRRVRSQYADYVGSDNVAGGRVAARYLAELGHTHVMQFAGCQRVSSYRERASGFEGEMTERGCAVQTALLNDDAELERRCERILAQPRRPTAVFCPGDRYAARVYKKLTMMGISVPMDVSVVGFGNLDVGEMLHPALTTINQKPQQVGIAAAEVFLERLRHSDPEPYRPRSILIPPELLQRESCRRI